MNHDDDSPAPGDGDIRVGDAMRATEWDPSALSQETLQRLSEWFGGPAPVDGGQATEPPLDDGIRQVQEQRQLACDAVIPTFLSRIFPAESRHREWKPFRQVADPSISTFAAPHTHEHQWVDRQRPVDVEDALRDDKAPQAILRDLHRPETFFELAMEVIHLGALPSADLRREAIAEALAGSNRASEASYTPSPIRVHDLYREIRDAIEMPWWANHEGAQ